MSKYGVFSDRYFPVFGLNTEKYGPEKTLDLDTFHAVMASPKIYLGSTRLEYSYLLNDTA